MGIIGNPNFISFGVNNGRKPESNAGGVVPGPRTCSLLLDFTSEQSITLDLKLMQQFAKLEFIQSIFVDNADNSQPLIVTGQVTNHRVVIPPYGQGFVALMVLSTTTITIATTGNLKLGIQLMNFAIPTAVWEAKYNVLPVVNGLVQVQDNALEALIGNLGGGAASAVNVVNRPQSFQLIGSQLNSLSGTGFHTLFTGNPYFFLDGIFISITLDISVASSSIIDIRLSDGALTLNDFLPFVPQTVTFPTSPTPAPIVFNWPGDIGYVSTVAYSLLQWKTFNAIASGNVAGLFKVSAWNPSA